MAVLFKGAGPGTHWWLNDARIAGGFHSPPIAPPSPAAAIRHVTTYSHPSPYVSFSASFDIARTAYALFGPGGPATAAVPGYVYEIDTALADVVIHDPLALIAATQPDLRDVPRLPTHHDGSTDLILAIAAPTRFPTIMTTPPRRLRDDDSRAPMVTPELQALIFALRDVEVLIERAPPACIVNRHSVW